MLRMRLWNNILVGLILAGLLLPSSSLQGKPTVLSGDLSTRFWVKTATESATGREATRRVSAERIRLKADGGSDLWHWQIGISTIDNRRLTSSIKALARENEGAVLTPADFQFVNAFAERDFSSRLHLRLGRTLVPFLRFKSELLWDNDVAWDGVWAEYPLKGLAKAVWHGGAFEIHRDLRFRGDRLYVLGAMGRPQRGNLKFEWRFDHFRYGFDRTIWKDNLAPAYRTVNVYGAVDFPQQIRLTLDLSRNLLADAPGAPHRGGDGLNATLVAGKMKHNGTFQGILQYLNVGPHAAPPALISYAKRINVKGIQFSSKYRLTQKTTVSVDFLDWRRLTSEVATDRRYRRWEISLENVF